MWSKQREIMDSVRDNRYTAVPSCHGSGKSAVAGRIGSWWLASHPPGEAFLVTTAPTFNQVKAILWREINKVHRIGSLPGWCNEVEWKIEPNELIGFGRAAKDMTSFQGIHARRVLVIGDEASGISREISEGMETLMTNEDCRMLKIGNPDDPTSAFAENCKPGSGYNVIRISAFDTPNFTGEETPDWMKHFLVSPIWVEERRKKWGEDSPMYRSKVLGLFPDMAEDSLLSLSSITSAQQNSYAPKEDDLNELGVDVARYGLDASVIYHRHGYKLRRFARMNKRDTMTVAGEVVRALKETGATAVKIDDTGLGGGVTDRLRELRSEGRIPAYVEIVAVNVGESCRDMGQIERFKNLRMQVNWMMRDIFNSGLLDIDENDDDLASQAVQVRYKVHSDGIMWMEKKDDMKKRTKGLSPDDWDAAVLAFTPKELGGVAVHTAVEDDIVVKHFDPPKQWARVVAVHIDKTRFSAVWCAVDAEAKINYLYSEYSAPLTALPVHADAIKQRGADIPVIFDKMADGRTDKAGTTLVDRLLDLHLDLYVSEMDREAAIVEAQTQYGAQRVKVSEQMTKWIDQFKRYRRDGEGEVVEGDDQLMVATELLLSSGVPIAAIPGSVERIAAEDWARESADSVTGY